MTGLSHPARRDPLAGPGLSVAPAPAFAALGVVLALVLGWRGNDLPAQLFRADLVRRHGVVLWNNLWYGGHPTVDYGLLTPVLGALTSPMLVGAVSCVVAAELFARVVRDVDLPRWRLASLVFAAATVVNLVVGRTPFALGLAIGLGAVRALQHRRAGVAVACALGAALASPVAGAFVALTAVAWAGPARARWRTGATVAIAAMAPVGVGLVLYPAGGHFPLRGAALVWDLAVVAVVAALAVRAARRELVWGAALYAVACVGAFVVSSPLGGNVSRLAQFVAPPLVVSLVPLRRRLVAAALVVPLVVWQWTPAVDGAVAAGADPSTRRAYHQPLVDFLTAQPGPPVRTEVVFTFRHWETTYVAGSVPLARGWQRQVDMERNPLFYDDLGLSAGRYRAWLVENAVGFVALPSVRLDASSEAEAALLRAGVPGLTEVWGNADWRVWRVDATRGLVDGPAVATRLGPTDVELYVDEPADLLVRVRYTGHWRLDGAGCVAPSTGGWTVVRGAQRGPLVLSQAIIGSTCDEDRAPSRVGTGDRPR